MTQKTRRSFLKSTAVAGAAATTLSLARSAHAAGSETLRVGLVGCGGRGGGAINNALDADAGTKVTALADMFQDRVDGIYGRLEKKWGDRFAVGDNKFTGFDGYKGVIENCDVVLLATPPYFRPMHLRAAIEAGKEVFCEKPIATDAPGVRSVMETAKLADEKKKTIVSGLCWRYHPTVVDIVKQVHAGKVGDIRAIRSTYNTGSLWHKGRTEEDTEMTFQLKNWLYFAWLSGDHITEQAIHSIDKASWLMGDKPPIKAFGLGGRQVRTAPKYGDIYDHHAVCFEYDNGVQVTFTCRQQAGCANQVRDLVSGTKGVATINSSSGDFKMLDGTKERVRGGGDMYLEEHKALFAAIRAGKQINNGQYMATSTMLAIMGRMVDYTGQELTWDQALGSQQVLAPTDLTMKSPAPVLPDADGYYPIAMPGITKFV